MDCTRAGPDDTGRRGILARLPINTKVFTTMHFAVEESAPALRPALGREAVRPPWQVL
jgi:hypothetical protein